MKAPVVNQTPQGNKEEINQLIRRIRGVKLSARLTGFYQPSEQYLELSSLLDKLGLTWAVQPLDGVHTGVGVVFLIMLKKENNIVHHAVPVQDFTYRLLEAFVFF